MKSAFALRRVSVTLVLALLVLMATAPVYGQQVGGDLVGGAGIFRPKNPAVKKKTTRKPTGKPKPGALTPEMEDRIEDAIKAGNEARDERRYQDSEKSYKSALQLNPKDARAHYGIGNVYADQQLWEQAENSYRQAIRYNQNDASVYIALGYMLLIPRPDGNNARRLAEAELYSRRATQLDPKSAAAFDCFGAAREARALLGSETEGAYRKAVELDPQYALAFVHLARLLGKARRSADAEAFYAKAIELANDPPTLVLIAETFLTERRFRESVPLLERALAMDARNPAALFLLARAWMFEEKYAEAEPLLKTVTEISPRSFQPHYLLATVFLQLGRFEEAERATMTGAAVATANEKRLLAGAFGLSGIGDGYLKAGRSKDAARAFEKALAFDPGNKEIEKKLLAVREQPQ